MCFQEQVRPGEDFAKTSCSPIAALRQRCDTFDLCPHCRENKGGYTEGDVFGRLSARWRMSRCAGDSVSGT
jgi:hypothetical protein